MVEFIRDKIALAEGSIATRVKPKNGSVQESNDPPEATEVDANSMKALSPPEGFAEASTQEEKPEEGKRENLQLAVVEADLLNLAEDAVTTQEHGDKLAIALFDGVGPSTSASSSSAWTTFKNNRSDWENTLVQSASRL